MNCASCGAGLLEGATFCGECGAKVESTGVLRVTLDDLDSPTRDTSPTPPAGSPTAPVGSGIGTAPPAPAFAPASGGLASPVYPPMPPARQRGTAGMVGAIIGAIGALTVILGSVLSWLPNVPRGVETPNAFRLPFAVLVDYKTQDQTDAGFGVLLIALAALGLATSFVPKSGLVRNICGAGVLVIAVMYLVQVNAAVDAANELVDSFGGSGSASLGDFLGAGFYVTAVGGLLMAAGPPRWR